MTRSFDDSIHAATPELGRDEQDADRTRRGQDAGAPKWLRIAGIALSALLSIALLLFALHLSESPALGELGERAASRGAIVFLAVFLGWELTTLPAIPLMIASGALFGPWYGTLYSLVGGMLGVSSMFWIGRLLGEKHFERLARRHASVARIAGWAETRPIAAVALLRLASVFPVTVLNYVIGATSISFAFYFWTSCAMTLPGAALYAGAGDALYQWWNRRSVAGSTWILVVAGACLALGATWWYRRQRGESGVERRTDAH